MGKILSLPAAAQAIRESQSHGKSIVLCHGVFDVLHIGHIRYLRKAREFGDILVVTCTPDKFVDKGPGRPVFNEQLRVEALASLDCVDFAVINDWPTAVETLQLLKPDFYVKGAEYKNLVDITGNIKREAATAKELGIRMEFTSDIVFSSSNLINRYFSNVPKEVREYLDIFRSRHSIAELTGYVESYHDLTVLLIGDAIIDEYIFCSPLGASSKDPILALLKHSEECYAGGAAAIANHLAQYVKKVIWITVLGDNERDFIANSLAPNVEMRALTRDGAPTVRKTRTLDSYSFQKLLEVYQMDRAPLPDYLANEQLRLFDRALADVDLALAADFGNGCITASMARHLSKAPVFLGVNTQSNAGNRGYHTIGRYQRADFVSLAVHEITLEFRNSDMTHTEMMASLQKKLSAQYVLLTEGRSGCSVLGGNDLQRAPSFAATVVDRVGAGDALFSLAALGAFMKIPADVIAFLGNIAGCLAVETIGNVKAVSREQIIKTMTAIMK